MVLMVLNCTGDLPLTMDARISISFNHIPSHICSDVRERHLKDGGFVRVFYSADFLNMICALCRVMPCAICNVRSMGFGCCTPLERTGLGAMNHQVRYHFLKSSSRD